MIDKENYGYTEVVRIPNPMENIYPLRREEGERHVIALKDLVNKSLKAVKVQNKLKQYNGTKIDPGMQLKQANVPLGKIVIDLDIQRDLQVSHIAGIIDPKTFDLALSQPITCVKNSKGEFIATDGQHTATAIATLIASGIINTGNWEKHEYMVAYYETDNMATARKSFRIINGKGKMALTKYEKDIKPAAHGVRIDGSTDPVDLALVAKLDILEENGLYPVNSTNAPEAKYPGTITHHAWTHKDYPLDFVKQAAEWHNKYFHHVSFNGSEWFMFTTLNEWFAEARLPLTDKILDELAGIIQRLFGTPEIFHDNCQSANTKHSEQESYKHVTWNPDCIACLLIQIYEKLGGDEAVPSIMLDDQQGYGYLLDYFDTDIKANWL